MNNTDPIPDELFEKAVAEIGAEEHPDQDYWHGEFDKIEAENQNLREELSLLLASRDCTDLENAELLQKLTEARSILEQVERDYSHEWPNEDAATKEYRESVSAKIAMALVGESADTGESLVRAAWISDARYEASQKGWSRNAIHSADWNAVWESYGAKGISPLAAIEEEMDSIARS